MVQELYLLSSNMPEYFDNIVKYFNSEGFSISNQSLNLEEEFNNLFREYGSAVGNTVVFAGRGILNAMFHFCYILFFILSNCRRVMDGESVLKKLFQEIYLKLLIKSGQLEYQKLEHG